jgi:hypothetical protein
MVDEPTLVPEQRPEDIKDGKEWSAADIEDLALALKDGGTVEGAAYFLRRAGTIEDVRHKAKELGLIGQ